VGSTLLVVALVLAAAVAVLSFATRRPKERRLGAEPEAAASDKVRATWKLLRQGDAAWRIAEQLRAGQKIEAIKLLREASGLGLAEAKSAVEDLERQLASDGPLARLLAESPKGDEKS
jgi:ribosomal protein L7/L12